MLQLITIWAGSLEIHVLEVLSYPWKIHAGGYSMEVLQYEYVGL